MATNWFDWAQAQEQEADATLSELSETADAAEDIDHAPVAEDVPKARRGLHLPLRASKPTNESDASAEQEEVNEPANEDAAPRSSRKLTSVMAIVAAIALAAMSGAAVMKMTESENSGKLLVSANLPAPTSTVTKPGPQPGVEAVDDDTKVAVAGSHCVPASGETKVTETDTTLRGALAAFERSYFERDAQAVKDALDPSTQLAKRDWQAVLDKTVVEGTQWCLRMQPVDGDHVEAAVTVTDPSGQASTYEQTVTATQTDGHFKLKDFS